MGPSAATPFRPGTAFLRGKLYLFERRGVTVIRGWPDPRGWRKTARRGWRHVRPRLDYLALRDAIRFADGEAESRLAASFRPSCDDPECPWEPESSDVVSATPWEREIRAYREFLGTIPAGVLEQVLRFPERHFHLVNATSRLPREAMQDFFHAAPAFAVLLANAWVFRRGIAKPFRSARTLAPRPRREIARWMGFPGTEAVARILAKLDVWACRVRVLLGLRHLLRDSEWERVCSHLPAMPATVAWVLADPRTRRVCTPRLALELATRDARDRRVTYTEVRDLVSMWRRLEPGRRPPLLRSCDQALEVHATLTRRWNALEAERALAGSFPPPPLHPADGVEAVATPPDLLEEGLAMGHCVATRASLVEGGASYVYRIREPERATFEIHASGTGWRLHEIRGPGNVAVAASTVARVERWLRERQPSDVEVRWRRWLQEGETDDAINEALACVAEAEV